MGSVGLLGPKHPLRLDLIVHDITLTVPLASLNPLPVGLAPKPTDVFPTLILTLLPLVKQQRFVDPTPAKVVDAKGVAPKNITVTLSKLD